MEDKLRYAKPAFIDLFVLLNMNSIWFSEHVDFSIHIIFSSKGVIAVSRGIQLKLDVFVIKCFDDICVHIQLCISTIRTQVSVVRLLDCYISNSKSQ